MGGSQSTSAVRARGHDPAPSTDREPPTSRSGTDDTSAVEVLHWPRDAETRELLARAQVPRLLLVDHGDRPPDDIGLDEDWTWVSADPATVTILAEALRHRVDELAGQPVILDDTGVLHRGARSIALSPGEATVMRILLDRSGVVSRELLVRALRPEGPPSERALGAIIYRLRRKLAGMLLVIDVRRRRGYMLLPDAARGS